MDNVIPETRSLSKDGTPRTVYKTLDRNRGKIGLYSWSMTDTIVDVREETSSDSKDLGSIQGNWTCNRVSYPMVDGKIGGGGGTVP